jgi:hypothetical protein
MSKGRHTTLTYSEETQIHSQENDTQGTQMLPEQSKRRQKKNINKCFQETANRNNDVTDNASQIKAEDLR